MATSATPQTAQTLQEDTPKRKRLALELREKIRELNATQRPAEIAAQLHIAWRHVRKVQQELGLVPLVQPKTPRKTQTEEGLQPGEPITFVPSEDVLFMTEMLVTKDATADDVTVYLFRMATADRKGEELNSVPVQPKAETKTLKRMQPGEPLTLLTSASMLFMTKERYTKTKVAAKDVAAYLNEKSSANRAGVRLQQIPPSEHASIGINGENHSAKKDRILQMLAEGSSVEQVAQRSGCSRSTVRRLSHADEA